MPTWVALLLVALAVASRPIEVRLWRAGRLSDRAVTLLVPGRFPVVVAIGAVAGGGDPAFAVILVLISVLPMLLCSTERLSSARVRTEPPVLRRQPRRAPAARPRRVDRSRVPGPTVQFDRELQHPV